MSVSSFIKKFSAAGAACLFSAAATAQQIDDPAYVRRDVIAKIDTLTVLQLSYSSETADRVNLVNIFCPYHDMAREYAPEGGVATLEQGTMDDLTEALDEYKAKIEILGLGNEGVKGFAMSIIDAHGTIHPAYTFNQASRQAAHYHTDADLAGVPPRNPGLIAEINQAYLTLCFGNS